MKWIKCSERLPEKDLEVFFRCGDQKYVGSVYGESKIWLGDDLFSWRVIQKRWAQNLEWLDENTIDFDENDMKGAYGCGWCDSVVFGEDGDNDIMLTQFNGFIKRTKNIKNYLQKSREVLSTEQQKSES